MSHKRPKRIQFGDRRLFAEATITEHANGPDGIEYPPGSIIRMSASIKLQNHDTLVALPSMAELIFQQAEKELTKAAEIQREAANISLNDTTGTYHIEDEEAFFIFMQLMCLGLLGLYSSMETMVYELYVRKSSKSKVMVGGRELTFSEFTNLGFERKITEVASQLSGKDNIYGTTAHRNAMEIHRLRNLIQHWNIERRKDYFINLPDNHPLKVFPLQDPLLLIDHARVVLDNYRLT